MNSRDEQTRSGERNLKAIWFGSISRWDSGVIILLNRYIMRRASLILRVASTSHAIIQSSALFRSSPFVHSKECF